MKGRQGNESSNNSNSNNNLLWLGGTAVVTAAAVATAAFVWKKRSCPQRDDDESLTKTASSAYESLIGNTPTVKLENLSKLLERSIHVKMECLNPGGTGKDRAALSMIRAAEQGQQLPPPVYQNNQCDRNNNGVHTHLNGDTPLTQQQPQQSNDRKNISSNHNNNNAEWISKMDETIQAARRSSRSGGIVVEGTSGSTGISLAVLSASRGHGCIVVLPDDQAVEKRLILQSLRAQVHVVPTASISNPHHYVNLARRMAERARTVWGYPAVFMDQFENPANFQVHYQETGPELLNAIRQNNNRKNSHAQLDAFVMSSGTGGTIAGVGRYLKEQQQQQKSNRDTRIVLIDPPGSSLYHKIEHGVAYAPQQAERKLRRHRYDTIAEGIGLDRVTHNFALGEPYVDQAIRVTDQEAVDMAHWLLQHEGLFVGSSSAMNVVGACRVAREFPLGSVVATVICDTGQRHVTRFWNRDVCVGEWGLKWPGDDEKDERIPECLEGLGAADQKS